jgi:phage terminase Nu1 subunit (DNA packaging protein)
MPATKTKKPKLPTLDELAAHFGKSRQTIMEWRRRGCPVGTIAEVERWRNENVKPQASSDSLSRRERIEKLKKLRAERKERERKNRVAEGELYPREDVDLAVSELCGLVRSRLESIPQELESEWPADVRAIVTERLRDRLYLILMEMSQWRLDV